MTNKEWMTIPEYAKHIGKSTQYIRKSRPDKLPLDAWMDNPAGKGYLIHVEKADVVYEENTAARHRPVSLNTPKELKPNRAQEIAINWANDTPEDTPAVIQNLRYLVKLFELDPEGLKIQHPGPGEDGNLITYTNVEDVPFQDALLITMIFRDPKDFEAMSEEENLPEWQTEQYEELKNRMDRS